MLTDDQVEILATQIRGHINCQVRCLRLVEVKFRDERNEKTINYVTGDISTTNLGDMKHSIKSYHIKVRLWIMDDGETFVAQPSFCYEYHDGGSNGCDMDFRLTGDINCINIRFQYRQENGGWS
jgi:hypothetical protein